MTQAPLLVLEPVEPVAKGSAVQRVWDAYVTARLAAIKGSRKPTLDNKRRAMIEAKLKTFSEADLVAACQGVFKSSFHAKNKFKHATIELVLRDAAHTERFISELAAAPPPKPKMVAVLPPESPEFLARLEKLKGVPEEELIKMALGGLGAKPGDFNTPYDKFIPTDEVDA